MVTFAYGCVHAFFFMNGMTCVCVCVCACPGPLAVFVDYKAMRISREKREQTDYTAALVQPKALRCSPESSDQLMRGDSIWKVLRPGWWKVLHVCWTYRKCSLLYANLRCWVEQGYTTSIELCWSESLPLCCSQCTGCERLEKVSLQHALKTFPKTHTHTLMYIGIVWRLSMHFPACYPLTTKSLTPAKNPQRPSMLSPARMSSLPTSVLTLQVKCVSCSSPQNISTCEQRIHFHL